MAISFAGGSDRVTGAIPAASPSETWSLWLRTTQVTNNAQIIGRHDATQSRNGFTNAANGIFRVYGKNTGDALVLPGSTAVNTGNWVHVGFVLRYDTTTNGSKIYVNGALDAQGTASGAWGGTAQNLYFGDVLDTFWPSYVGELAEMANWGVDLTPDEFVSLSKGFSPRLIRPASLISHIRGIRSIQEVKGIPLTVTGTTASNHPRVY